MTELSKIYQPRTGINFSKDLEASLKSEEVLLSPEKTEELRRFSYGLFEGKLGNLKTETELSLEDVNRLSLAESEQTFYMPYFTVSEYEIRQAMDCYPVEGNKTRQDQVEEILQDRAKLGFVEHDQQGNNTDMLSNVEFIQQNFTTKDRKQIATRSQNFKKALIASTILKKDSSLEAETSEDDSLTINYDPGVLLKKLKGLRDFKKFYKQVRSELKDPDDELSQQKIQLVDIHIGRVNSLIAVLYPSVLSLIKQREKGTEVNPQDDPILVEIEKCAPIFKLVNFYKPKEGESNLESFIRRLDYLRNGAVINGEGRVSALSPELLSYAKELDEHPADGQATEPKELTDVEMQEIDNTVWDAQTMASFFKSVLRRIDCLSKHDSDWDEVDKRSTWAEDEKFQIIIVPKAGSLAVNSVKGVIKIPASFKRSLSDINPAGCLPLAAHELAHVLQAFYDRELGKSIPLARIKGRHALPIRESGGLSQEKVVQEKYFGRSKLEYPHYLRAVMAKINGAGRVNVARAFYDSYRRSFPASEANNAAFLAADRTARIYRYGGHNTQVLDYLEQALVAREISRLDANSALEFILSSGTFDIKDMSTLKSMGLVSGELKVKISPAEIVMKEFLENIYLTGSKRE